MQVDAVTDKQEREQVARERIDAFIAALNTIRPELEPFPLATLGAEAEEVEDILDDIDRLKRRLAYYRDGRAQILHNQYRIKISFAEGKYADLDRFFEELESAVRTCLGHRLRWSASQGSSWATVQVWGLRDDADMADLMFICPSHKRLAECKWERFE